MTVECHAPYHIILLCQTLQEQAKKDLARLAEVRARREAAAKKREEEIRRT